MPYILFIEPKFIKHMEGTYYNTSIFGHICHGARTLFRDVFGGIDLDLDAQVKFGAFQKLGDATTKRQLV